MPKPLPDQAAYERPYWDAATRRELMLQRVVGTEQFVHPPAMHAPHWHAGAELEWVSLGGAVTGAVYSFTVIHRAFGSFAEEVPYAVALCDVDGAPGARVVGNLFGVTAGDVRIGMRVRLTWEERAEGVTIPQWEAA